MNYEDVLTFLTVLETQNIAQAARTLFVSQGTASTRIRRLEEELGIPLFYRQKGFKNVTLTPYGSRLVPIAQNWMDLYREAHSLGSLHLNQTLTVAATDTLNLFLLSDFYKAFISEHPEVSLKIMTYHSQEISRMVDSQRCDIGISNSLFVYPSIQSSILLEEAFVFLCHKNSPFAGTRDISCLKGEKEVLNDWSSEFGYWHQHYFASFKSPKIVIGTPAMITNFLDDEESWCIIPASLTGRFLERLDGFCAVRPDIPIPRRKSYFLCRKARLPETDALIDCFRDACARYLAGLSCLQDQDSGCTQTPFSST